MTESNKVSSLTHDMSVMRKAAEELRVRIQRSQESQEQATRQLLSERTLRQSAETRADNYHAELVAALKMSANWSSKSVNRRAIYTDIDSPDPEPEARQTTPIGRGKPLARDRAREVTDKTLASLLEEVRASERNAALEFPLVGQVGPEFGSPA